MKSKQEILSIILIPIIFVGVIGGCSIAYNYIYYRDQIHNGKFACAINCMDGRVQDAVKRFMKINFNVEFVDQITEPGPNKILAECADKAIIDNIVKRACISVHHHHSNTIAIVGHHGCAGNPATKDEQLIHLKKARETLKSLNLDAKIVMLWVEKDWETVQVIE